MTRPANPAPTTAPDPEPIAVRVTKRGDGKISTGQHLPGQGDVMFERGETLEVSPAAAFELEARGFAETIEDA